MNDEMNEWKISWQALLNAFVYPGFIIFHISLAYQSTSPTKENDEVSLTYSDCIKPVLVLRDSPLSLHYILFCANLYRIISRNQTY